MSTLLIFIFLASLFIIGFLGNQFFKKTKISDIVFLILIGFLLGPCLKIIPETGLNLLKEFAPFFGALALIILLFEGGLHLNFYKVIKEFGRGFSFAFLIFVLTSLLITIFLFFVFDFPFFYGLLIGVILAGTCSAVVVPLISKSKANAKTKILLTLESAITDVLCVVGALIILDIIIAKTTTAQVITQTIFGAFAIAAVIGILGAIIWLHILRDFPGTHEYSYLLTLSVLFLLYALTEFAKGNGAFTALVFGIIMGNSKEILRMLRTKEFTIDYTFSKFQAEISLFVKTFFFVYLGLILELTSVTFKVFVIAICIVVLAVLARWVVSKIVIKKEELKYNQKYIMSLHARGLAAAVLATYPLALGIINEYTSIILPLTFLVIIITNISATIWFYKAEKTAIKNQDNSKISSNNNCA
jgi:cell volume regulation protein A